MSTRSNSKTKSCLRSKNKTLGYGPTATVQPPPTLYVSLDNADSVIEGGRRSRSCPETGLGEIKIDDLVERTIRTSGRP